MRILLSLVLFTLCSTIQSRRHASLVPSIPSAALDYFSTWNIQGYVVDYDGPQTVAVMDEKHMFGNGPLEGWCSFFPDFREDLIFLMDDSWDCPPGTHDGKRQWMGEARLDTLRFPSCTGTPTERVRKLTEMTKRAGWKGLGGWICAQEAEVADDRHEVEAYWKQRLKECADGGMSYWKVDFGRQERNIEWRCQLTKLGREYAPAMPIEHAYTYDVISDCDVFRTYDVEVVTSVPVTIARTCKLLTKCTHPGNLGLVNCEDEPLVAVGLGCVIGVMRHPLSGALPCGLSDHVFPVAGRDLKHRMDEVNRALKWHRIAMPFAVNDDALIDTIQLADEWVFGERETWVSSHHPGDTIVEKAPARISRRMPLPEVKNQGGEVPYVLCSRYPNDAVCVATVERLENHTWVTPKADVTLAMGDAKGPIGIFGEYEKLCLRYDRAIDRQCRIWAQDLKGTKAVDVTKNVTICDNEIIIPGTLIQRVGTMAATPGDRSPAGLVMVVEGK